MKQVILIFVFINFTACENGGGYTDSDKLYRSNDLKPFINNIIDNLKITLEKINIVIAQIDDVDYNICSGVCIHGVYHKTILIDLIIWESLNDHKRQALLLHEIGHCKFKLKHNDNLKDDNCPVSIMHFSIVNVLSTECWDLYKDEYIQEFIDKETKLQEILKDIN